MRIRFLALAALALASCSDDSSNDNGSAPSSLAPLATGTTLVSASTAPVTAAATSTTPMTTPPTTLAPTTSTTTTSTTSTTTTTTTTTTLPPTTTTIVTQGAIVLVANASGVSGAAAELTNQLNVRGFSVAEATNAAGNEEELEASRVYFQPSGEAVGRSVALLLGGVPADPMPTPVPIVGANEALGEATVVVMLGKDLAGRVFS